MLEKIENLSKRESEVLGLLAVGMKNADIAAQLGVSINTVKTQLKQVYRKLNVTSRYEAMSSYLLNQKNHSTTQL